MQPRGEPAHLTSEEGQGLGDPSRPQKPDHHGDHIDDIGAAGEDELAFDPGAIFGSAIDAPEKTNKPTLVNAKPGLERIGENAREGGDEGESDRQGPGAGDPQVVAARLERGLRVADRGLLGRLDRED